MRFSPVLSVLGCLLLAGGVQLCAAAGQARTAPSPARAALDQMSPAEQANCWISLEFESHDSEAAVAGHDVERLWNGGQYDEALVQLGNLEARVGRVAIGNSWRRPVPTDETNLWGRDVRIGNRDSVLELSLDLHRLSGNLFVALRRGRGPHFSVCMSADSGATWGETFTWSGSPPTSLDAAVLGNHLYVVYNSPSENAREVRMRRFLCSTGQADTFRGGGGWVVPCTLDAGDTMREVSLVPNQNNNQLHIVALVSDGSVLVSYGDANAVSWTGWSTGITSGARSGLDATDDGRSDTTHLFFSYYDATDTLRICGGFGQPLSLPAGNGTLTSISAYLDTVICVYEDGTSSPHRVRYLLSYDGGETGTTGMLSDSGVAADAPAVTALGGGAALFRHESPEPELRLRQRTDSGPWSEPVSIADKEPYWSRPGIEYLGAGIFGVVYLSNRSPVVRGAFFDRSDWPYGLAEQRRLQASDCAPLATVIHGTLFLLGASSRKPQAANLLDAAGRKVLDLQTGANSLRGLAPGVYFVREEAQASSFKPQAVWKIVVTE